MSKGSTGGAVDVYRVDDFVFSQLIAEDGDFGWDVSVEITNNGEKAFGGVNFTATFYDVNGKRLGTALGSVLDFNIDTTKTATMITSDDLTGWKSVKFQIDVKV